MHSEDAQINVTFPDVDVPVAVAAVRRMNDLFDALWASGRLRSLMEVYEGSEAVHAFTAVFLSAMRQLNEAEKAALDVVTISVQVRPSTRLTLIAFARRLLELMGDAATMRSIGADPLRSDELGFIVPFVDRAEGVLAAG